MALEDSTPAVRVESLLNGDEIAPATRLEYFLQKAATELPKVAAADAGKVLAVNASGEWAAESPVLKLEFDDLDSDKLLCSYNKLKESLEKGKVVYYIEQVDDDSTIYTNRVELFRVFGPTNDKYKAQFIATYWDANESSIVYEMFQYTANSADQPYMMFD